MAWKLPRLGQGESEIGEVLTNWVCVVPAEQTIRTKAVLLTSGHGDEVLAKEVQPAVDNLYDERRHVSDTAHRPPATTYVMAHCE